MNAPPLRSPVLNRRGLVIGFAVGALLMLIVGGIAWWSLGSAP